MSGAAAAAAAGCSSANTSLMLMEEARQRKLNEIGRDQITIETEMSVDEIGNAISTIRDDWTYKGGYIHNKPLIPFSVGAFFVMACSTGLALFFGGLMSEVAGRFPIGFLFNHLDELTVLSLAAGIIIGLLDGSITEIPYIKITELKKHNVVLIKLYNSNGHRNIDDDDVLKIANLIRPLKF